MPDLMRIAVAGDVHGHLALLYRQLGRWREQTGREIHLILQVGDLGAFGPDSVLDRATQRHAERDPEELGFAQFAGERPPATPLDPRPPLVFVPGNHEDFELLERAERAAPSESPLYPVSHDGLIQGLRSGRKAELTAAGHTVRVGGVSGVANRPARPGRHPRLHLREDEALALAESGRLDILISHDRPAAVEGRFRHDLGGSEALQLVVETARPALAFFGHYDRWGEWRIGDTRVFGLAGVGYEHRSRRARPNGIMVVEWDGEVRRVAGLDGDWRTASGAGEGEGGGG
jgi:hypothetical protein